MDMRRDAGDVVVRPSREADGALASLAGGPLAGRFCAWRGVSGRRYVATVHPLDRAADGCGLPDYDAFVLIAVGGGPASGTAERRILDIATIERAADRRAALARGLARGANEWHVHFLADDRRARAAMIDDVSARHLGGAADTATARCA